jgi:hypothetical protein
MWGKGTLVHCWWECKPVKPLWKKIWRFLKNLNTDLPYDPAIPLKVTEVNMRRGSRTREKIR